MLQRPNFYIAQATPLGLVVSVHSDNLGSNPADIRIGSDKKEAHT